MRYLLLLLVWSIPVVASAQPVAYRWYFEDLAASDEEIELAADRLERLTFDITELASLPGITRVDARALPQTMDWAQLETDLSARQRSALFEFWSRSSEKPLATTRSRVQWNPDAAEQRGFRETEFQGTASKIYNRLLFELYDARLGLLQVKDVGEPAMFDRVGGFLALGRIPIASDLEIAQVILGDYALQIGSGLLFSNSGLNGKSSEVIDAVEAGGERIDGYLSSSYSNGFRGAAAVVKWGSLTTRFFFSSRSYDAVIDSGIVTSIDLDGYHRTTSEIDKSNAVASRLWGVHAAYPLYDQDAEWTIGATTYSEHFSLPVRTGGFAYNFRGTDVRMASVNSSFGSRTIGLDVEAAWSRSDVGSAVGVITSLVWKPSAQLRFAINGRYLPHDFVSRHGGTFGESTDDAQNERGVYAGVAMSIMKGLAISAYADVASTIAPPYGDRSNTRSNDFLLMSEYEVSEKTLLALRLCHKQKTTETSNAGQLVTDWRKQTSARFDLSYHVLGFDCLSRIEAVNVGYGVREAGDEPGALMMLRIGRSLFDEAIRLELGVARFSTKSYDSRCYIFETDVPGASTLLPLYGNGWRYSMRLSAEVLAGITGSAKLGITKYDRDRTIGSGLTERLGTVDSRISVQLDTRF